MDTELRVHGIDALRVLDASVMPDMIGGNINAAITAIAERAPDLVRGARSQSPGRDERRAAGLDCITRLNTSKRI